MIHRRHPATLHPSSSTAPRASTGADRASPPKINTTYMPLRQPQIRSNSPLDLPGSARPAPLSFHSGSFGGIELGEEWSGDGVQGKSMEQKVKRVVGDFKKGLEDSLRLDRSLGLVWSDRELGTLVLKSSMINILSLVLLSLSSIMFSPLLIPISPTMEARTKEIGLWYNVLLSWPVFVVCFWVNASWGPRISRRAQTMLHPTYRSQPTPASTPIKSKPSPSASTSDSTLANVFSSIARILLISDFTLVSRVIGLLPGVGKLGAFAYMCVVDSYYCFEWNFSMKQWPLEYCISYIQDRLAYMVGFGLPATLMTSFGPPLVTMAIFALIYPLFVIQALQARPPTGQSSLLPSTPTASSPLPPSPSSPSTSTSPSSFFPPPARSSCPPSLLARVKDARPRLPLFWFAKHALEGLRWLEEAVARDRSEKGVVGLGIRERPGKRLM
ncbi:hypothetical protein IAR50_002166 [Cryptococcus sp. DSM 104548]